MSETMLLIWQHILPLPLCTRDRAIPPSLQRRMIAENTSADVIELDTDHTPQLSMTNELARASTESRCTHLQVPEGSQIGKIVLTLGNEAGELSGVRPRVDGKGRRLREPRTGSPDLLEEVHRSDEYIFTTAERCPNS